MNTSTMVLNFNIIISHWFDTIRLVNKVVAKLMVKNCFTTCTGVDPGFSEGVMRAWPQGREREHRSLCHTCVNTSYVVATISFVAFFS